MLFHRFQHEEGFGDTVTGLVRKKGSGVCNGEDGRYSGFADETLQRKSKLA